MPRWLLGLVVLALTAPFWDLGHPLIEVDDARYAEVPREMLASGDWATPRLNELDYVEKPPLWYWLAASSYKAFGVSEASARLPLALLAVLGLAGTAWLGSWLYSPAIGLTAAVILSSSCLYFFLAHYITPDMALTVFLLWCSGMILRALARPDDARWAGPLAWLFAGLAFLSKGLVALVFPVGWSLLLAVLFPEWRRGLRGLLNPLGPILFAALVLPWLLLMQSRHRDFLHVFFMEQHFQRFATQKYNRASPWYFFLLVLPAGMLPWTPAVLSGLAQALRERLRDPRGAALALWAGLVLVFFSSSQSKLATYILPVAPHLALLAAPALAEPPLWCRRFAWGLGAGLILAPLTVLVFPRLTESLGRETLVLALIAAVILGTALVDYGRQGLSRKLGPALILGLAGLCAGGAALAAMRSNSETLSARSLSLAIAERCRPGDLIYTYGTYLHGIPFYTRHRVDSVINWVGELHYAKRDPANAPRFGDDNDMRLLPLEGRRVFVALRRFEIPYVLTLRPGTVPRRAPSSASSGKALTPGKIRRRGSFGDWELVEY